MGKYLCFERPQLGYTGDGRDTDRGECLEGVSGKDAEIGEFC